MIETDATASERATAIFSAKVVLEAFLRRRVHYIFVFMGGQRLDQMSHEWSF